MRMLMQFKKDDIVRHLGLLDLQRTMQRALRRSGLPVAYSKGFNPHMVMAFASALSSGIPGDAELLDVSLCGEVTEQECLAAMNRVLPPALKASRIRLVDDRFPKTAASLAQAEYRITLTGGKAGEIAQAVPAFLDREEIMALRKTKKSETMVNIRPMIHELTAQYDAEQDRAIIEARVSFVEAATLKPDLLMSTLCDFAGGEAARQEIRRTRLLGLVNNQPVALIDM
ncbi:MAG: DUF2344 domain-containing protein [Clostridia bacterium]|nr:DUF2344 domain-containing protein [Clostridia bacterium]